MKRIITSLIVALPLIATTALPKPASALSITANSQVDRHVDGAVYVAQYDRRDDGQYDRRDDGRYGRPSQRRRVYVPGHYEYSRYYHRRVFVPGHYIYR